MLTRRAFLAAWLPGPALAQEYIAVDGPLSDEDFYRVVACAAPPGAACGKDLLFWPLPRRLSLRVGIASVSLGFPSYKFDLIDRALDAAIDEINAVGAELYLERRFSGAFDVPIYLVDAAPGGRIDGTGNSHVDGAEIALGRVSLRYDEGEILEAAIAISREISRRAIASVLLEELVQAMGLPTDISADAYRGSIFSEDGNSVVWLRGQDAEALRMHYPRS